MKTIRILLLTIIFVFFQPVTKAAVRILNISADDVSFCAKPKKAFKKLKPTSRIAEGSAIRTGENSYVDLEFEERVLVRVCGGSELEILHTRTTASQDRDVRVYCRKGKVVCASPPLTAASKLEVATTTGVCGARGPTPEFEATAADGRIHCLAGTVVVVYVITPAPPITLGPGDGSALLSDSNRKWIEKLNDQELASLSKIVSDLKKSKEDYEALIQKLKLRN